MHFHPAPRAIDDEVSVRSNVIRGKGSSDGHKSTESLAQGLRGMRQNSQRMFSTPPCRRNRRQQQTGSASIVIPHADIVYLPTRKRVML